jgi:hypothetical protein
MIKSNKENIYYLIDLKSKENMIFYHSLKGRFDYKIQNKDVVEQDIYEKIKDFVLQYDYIVYPESSSNFIENIVNKFNINKFKVKKRKIEDVISYCETLNLQKKEKESHLEKITSMGSVFKINKMKANQRLKYEKVIFENITLPEGKGLILDDSLFSGTTYRGLISVAGKLDFLAIFSK